MHCLAESTLDAYRAAFLQAVADGRRRQLVSPQILVASYLLPALWLSIPHTTRPWLYKTRWPVALLVVGLSAEQISRCSSTNVAFSYGAGLFAAYGSLVCLHLLIWPPRSLTPLESSKSAGMLHRSSLQKRMIVTLIILLVHMHMHVLGMGMGRNCASATPRQAMLPNLGRAGMLTLTRLVLNTGGSDFLTMPVLFKDSAGRRTSSFAFEEQAGHGQCLPFLGRIFPKSSMTATSWISSQWD